MGTVINFDQNFHTPDVVINNATWTRDSDRRRSHAAEPLKNIQDIYRVSDYLITNKKYRDNLLFIMGINFGFRISDLLNLTYGHLVDQYGNLKTEVIVQEQKTGKYRTVYMNAAVAEALKLYTAGRAVNRDDYLFTSESTNHTQLLYDSIQKIKKVPTDKNPSDHYTVWRGYGGHIDENSVLRMLKKVINDELHIDVHASTHLLRKTFAYQTIMTADDRERAIEFLQMLLNHRDQRTTLRYAGITDDEVRHHFENLNLGYSGNRVKMDFASSSGLRFVRSVS